MATRTGKRRGVILMLVLSLLVVFLLLATTFLIVSSQYLKAAKAHANVELRGDNPQKHLDQALYQLLRGTRLRSSLEGHDIFGDLYGEDGLLGTVTGVAVEAGGQFWRINFTAIGPIAAGGAGFSPLPDYYNGRVITFLTYNPAAPVANLPVGPISTRVVDYVPGSATAPVATGVLRVEAAMVDGISLNPGQVLFQGRFLINGAAFNGTGAGLNPLTNNLDFPDPTSGQPMALLPHFVAYTSGAIANVGGADESYDAADYQNMFLAMVPPGVTASGDIIPSFHRPSLVNYWATNNPGLWGNAAFQRQVMFRPLPADHPNFTGSNPSFHPINGPWDVDNTGNGIRDSIWIDVGLPPVAAPNGRLVKPLVAMLVQDMDGRVNLNVHGSALAHFAGGFGTGPARGRGYGVAEIFLNDILGTAEAGAIVAGRYGPDGQPGLAGAIPPANLLSKDGLSRIKDLGLPLDYARIPSAYATHADVWGGDATALDAIGQPTSLLQSAPNQSVDEPYEFNVSALGMPDVHAVDSPYTFSELEALLRTRDADTRSLPNRLSRVAPSAFGNARIRDLVTVDSRHIPVPNVSVPPELRGSMSPIAPTILDLYVAKLQAGGVPPAQIPAQLARIVPFEMLHGQLFNVNRYLGNRRDDNGNGVIDEPNEADNTSAAGHAIWNGLNITTPHNNAIFDFGNDDPLIALRAQQGNADFRINRRRFAPQIYARHLYCLMMLLTDSGYLHPDPAVPPPRLREVTSARIAQWAINVVEFHDSDSIMQPFEYDVNPWNGWQNDIDGRPDTVEGGDRRIAWGCEYPDLLLTEAVAFHDRRVADTADDSGDADCRQQNCSSTTQQGDNDLDQVRIPQGSLFLEVYCTGNSPTNNVQRPFELYDPRTGALDLGRMAPAGVGGRRHPVWRVVITNNPAPRGGPPGGRPPGLPPGWTPPGRGLPPGGPPGLPGGVPPGLARQRTERIVWFAPADPGTPGTDLYADITYFNRGSPSLLAPGGYAVVGPRQTTHIGSRQRMNAAIHEPSPHVFSLAGGTFRAQDNDGNSRYPGFANPVGIICAAHPPNGWMTHQGAAPDARLLRQGIGLSVSEPEPQNSYYPAPEFTWTGSGVPDAYDEEDPSLRLKVFPDRPYDENRQLGNDNLLQTDTEVEYKFAFLQRLANPLDGWNPLPGDPGYMANRPVNPYITIDASLIDLTVFNGEDRPPSAYDAAVVGRIGHWDPSDPRPLNDPEFTSRERGRRSFLSPVGYTPTPGGANPNADTRLWPPDSTGPLQSAAVGPAENHYRYNLAHTLGYINRTMSNGNPIPPEPFPWLTWANRPLDNPFELTLVPHVSPSEIVSEFGLQGPGDPYDGSGGGPNSFFAPYKHLINFFHSSSTPTTAAHFYRLLDYVETPSRFVGAETTYNPASFATGAAGATFRPPFNELSRFRDPGRININTATDPLIWGAIAKGFPPMSGGGMWNQVVASRRGYMPTAGNLNASFPTQFAQPFRAATSADLAPLPQLRTEGVQVGLLRAAPGNPSQPLFDFNSGNPSIDTSRNAFFRYQAMSRLSNLLTTHSNVFAVWITVGYFELEPNPTGVDAAHPDGHRLGQELGWETGEIKRHRAFYMIDRSVPVAYQRGENHNIDRAIAVRQFIE